jgi:hypothetical protein
MHLHVEFYQASRQKFFPVLFGTGAHMVVNDMRAGMYIGVVIPPAVPLLTKHTPCAEDCMLLCQRGTLDFRDIL